MDDSESVPDRVAVISDIHGNLPALQAVLEELDSQKIEAIYCLGDIVGYGGNPNECVDLIRSREIPTVLGNHDQAALGRLDITNFNTVAKQAILWTQEALNEENQAFLESTPMYMSLGDLLLVHASPRNPEEWNYVLTIGEARINFEHFTEPICCIGHSHQPFIIENDGENLTCPSESFIEIKPDCKYLVNVGSVGQPRDQNPEPCFFVYNRNEKRVDLNRVTYDIQAAQEAILNQGLPQILATRLAFGN